MPLPHNSFLPARGARLFFAGIAFLLFPVAGTAGSSEYVEEELEWIRKLHARIVAEQKSAPEGKAEPYTAEIPGTAVAYEMAPVPAGRFLLGSPEDEPGRRGDEGPQRPVEIAAFWMGARPVTWNEFEPFMFPDLYDGETGEPVDAVSRPTPPYVDVTYGMGAGDRPAISITHQAAAKYCQWLSAKTGRFYRLPTETEWEYAARAGSETACFFGDDPADLARYAWYEANSEGVTRPVGTRKPNPWGLYDMHGNVWEWTLDAYDPDGYEYLPEEGTANPWRKPEAEYPRVVRGGSWADGPGLLRSAARRASTADWKRLDSQLPPSVWYHTNAEWLGFRIVRPREIPTPEEMYEYWNR